MGTRDFDNLVKATGRTAASGGMSFNDSLPNSPRAVGDSFGCYELVLGENSRNFDGTTIYDNYRTFTWVANLDSANSPNLLNDLVGRSTSILLGNVFDGENNVKPSGISIVNPTISYGAASVTATFMLVNSSSFAAYPLEGLENAWYEADVTFSHAADNYFNDPQFLTVGRVKIRPSLIGQGTPSIPPNGISPTAIYPHPTLGNTAVRLIASTGWFALGAGNIEIQWATDPDFTTSAGTGSDVSYDIGTDPNFEITFYVRARVISPYVGPYTSVASLYFFNPAPDV